MKGLPAEAVVARGNGLELPFPDNSFDIVCDWRTSPV